MSDTIFIIFFISLIAANIIVFIYLGVSEKWSKDKKHLKDFLQGCKDLQTELDCFIKDAAKIPENIVSEITPVIDSYIKERVEECIRASAGATSSASGEANIIPWPADIAEAKTVPFGNEGAIADVTFANDVSFEDTEATMRSAYFMESYKDSFLHEPEKTFRASTGKQVNIRPEYHQNILRILETAGCGCSTLTGFIDNVLADHFYIYGKDIEWIIKSRNVNSESL